MSFSARDTLNRIDERIRKIERSLEKCELREKQLIIMFKMILDKFYFTSRQKKRGTTTIVQIIEFMESLVNKNLTPEEQREPVDLLSEVIKKGY